MHQCSLGVLDPVRVLDVVLQYLEVHLPRDRTGWTGRAHSMKTHELGGIAVLHLLLDRWLPSVEYVLTFDQNVQLLTIVLAHGLTLYS